MTAPEPPVDDLPAPVAGLPAPVARWRDAVRETGVEGVGTIAAAGTGRVRLGRLPWLPIDHRTVHRLGRDQVRDIRLRVGPVPVLRVIDAYVDEAGITKIGPVANVGPEIDQGAFLAMWVEAIFWPRTWDHAPGLRWEGVDDGHARLHLPFHDETPVYDVAFDPATGYPQTFEVDRYKTKDRKVRWRAECFDLRAFGGVRAWGRISATWTDEPGPWYEARFDSIETDVAVDAAIARARRAIGRARGRSARSGG